MGGPVKRNAEQVEAIMACKGEPVDVADHQCQFGWCTGTIWTTSHGRYEEFVVTGRPGDVVDGGAVSVVIGFDETEDIAPRILLHLGMDVTGVDEDVSPMAGQARRIAGALLQAADALEDWRS